ncbi:HDOD domain-containing protein [Thalassotalea euphylliae]|uniref:HDOD domain-containing protein n=1 Tax=Thalassotalea euphylliae TaxID=1655234 RepID=A0A3E0TQC5_9GAMM|nr:HDOD domain-containing protein [Thalassotalea euphylliae]REL26698.1 HDOD domain-containing protein [Thalassotalea euphylliae]
MYSTYIARQAILDRNANTIGYELLFRDSSKNEFPIVDPDVASAKLIIQNHIHGDIEAITMGKVAFINFTQECLVHKFPLLFDPKSIVIEVAEQENNAERLLKLVKSYHQRGYQLALTAYDTGRKWDAFFPYLAYIKVDIDVINPKRLFSVSERLKPYDIKLVAEKVESNLQLLSLVEVGFNYYQGYFYHEPEIIEGQTLAPVKAQMVSLMNEAFKSPMDFDAIARVISQDVQLSVGLLKMVNNVATGTRVEITSLKQAAAYLGEEKLRQFVSILALSKMTTEKTQEAAKQALVTAKLMEAIAGQGMFVQIKELAFITGLLSSIDVVLGQPISEVVRQIPLAKPIELALLGNDGLLGELLTLTTSYILGNSEEINSLIDTYMLDAQIIHQDFVAASKWCQSLTA